MGAGRGNTSVRTSTHLSQEELLLSEEDYFLDFDLFLTLCVRSILHSLNEPNLVEGRWEVCV